MSIPVNDATLDREFAYVSWSESCQRYYWFDLSRQCRRDRGHTGECASGFGSKRLRWAFDPDTDRLESAG